jgi:hypothetical protein
VLGSDGSLHKLLGKGKKGKTTQGRVRARRELQKAKRDKCLVMKATRAQKVRRETMTRGAM